jgi:hypothetical protein
MKILLKGGEVHEENFLSKGLGVREYFLAHWICELSIWIVNV